MLCFWLLSCFSFCSSKYLSLVNKNSVPPEMRNSCGFIYHKRYDSLYLFGGADGEEKYNDIWVFFLRNYTWERIEITSPVQPPPRTNSLFFINQADDSVFYMFGGIDIYGEKMDLWEFSIKHSRWKNIKNFKDISNKSGTSKNHGIINGLQVIVVIGGKDIYTQFFDLNIIYVSTLEIKKYEYIMFYNLNGLTYIYDNSIYYTWGMYDEDRVFSFYIYMFIESASQFYAVGQSIQNPDYFAQSTTNVLYKNYYYFFDGYTDSGEIHLYTLRADMSNPGNFFEEIEFTNFHNRALPGLAVKDDNLYIFGGFYTSFTNELIIANFNTENKTIEAVMTFKEFNYPKERVYFTFIAIDHRIILFGGYNKGIYFNDLWIFYTNSTVWKPIEMKGSLPSRRRSHASGAQGDALIIWGGEDKTGLKSDFFIYNILKKSWREIIPNNQGPSPRKGACGALKFPKYYIFGGKTDVRLSKEAWEYNFNTNLYTELASSPDAFYHANCQLLENLVYIMGAKNNENVGFNQIFNYDINSKSWSKSYIKAKDVYFVESVSVMFPNYFIEYGGVYKDIEANKQIKIYLNNGKVLGPWEQRWSVFASASAYVLSNLYYFSGGLESPSITITRERSSNKFNYIPLYDITKDMNIQLYCAPGSYISKNDKCEFCPSSSYSEKFYNRKCTLCPPGTVSNNFALSSSRQCYPCREGTFNSKSGQKECRICPSNQYCPIGSVNPIPWRPAYISTSIQPNAYHVPNISGQIYDFFMIFASVSLTAFIIFLLLIPRVSRIIYKLDIYTTLHETEIDKPLVITKNKIGGSFTLMFIGIGIVIFGLNLINFSLRNVDESKSLQPLSVFENEVKDFKSDINVTVSFGYYLDMCGIDEVCQDGVEINATNIISGKKDIKCKKSEFACDIVFLCKDCEIGTESSVVFKLNQQFSFSTTIHVAVSSESSIPESDSSMARTITSPAEKIFVGSIASKFYYSLTPSVFYSAFRQFPNKATGYHISEYSPPSYGSSFAIEDIITESGLIAVINLEKSAFGFFTYRNQKQSAFLIASAVIGSIAGVFKVIGFIMGIIEGFLNSYYKKLKKREKLEFMIHNRIMLQADKDLDNEYSNERSDYDESVNANLKSEELSR